MKAYVDVHDRRWNKYKIDFEKIVNIVVGKTHKNAEVSIILTGDEEIHQINKAYRGIDKPTNVLSFELGDDVLLGDIYISFDTVKKEAHQQRISFHDHVTHMVVHGMFHLMGYDHLDDSQAKIMETKEVAALKKMGIKNPYEDDANSVCDNACCCPGSRFVSWIKQIYVRENSSWQYALYALFGGIAAFGFAPFYQWWCTVLGVAGAYWLTVRNNNIGGCWKSLMRVAPFGAMYAVVNFWWVLHSIYVAPELTEQFAIWTIPGLVGLAFAGGLIFSWPFVAIAQKKLSSGGRVILFACVWTLILWAREWLFTGFPWNPIANITMIWPMVANSMSVWGAIGLSFIVVGLIAVIVEIILNRKNKSVWGVAVGLCVLLSLGMVAGFRNMNLSDSVDDSTGKMIRIVQPAELQVNKATHNREVALENAEVNLRKLMGLAMQPGDVDMVVFPETTYPFVVMPDDNILMAKVLDKPIIIGANSFENGRLSNSMIVVDAEGQIQRIYSKSHLVPFGEYRPLGLFPSPIDLAAGNGAEIITVDDFVFAPAICYEIIFSDSILPSNDANVGAIINITNDNWFGKTPGTYQHLDMVRRYAIESGLPIVRANYSGISAFVAADGAIESGLPIGAAGVLDGFVWGAHVTPYREIGLDRWMIIILIVSILGIKVCDKKRL